MKNHRFLAILTAVALLATACGGGGDSGKPAAQPAAQPTSASSGSGAQAAQPTAAAAKPAGTPAPAKAPSSSGGSASANLEKVNMPSGAAKYDGTKILKVGDVVDLPISGLVMQVTGAKTTDFDAQRDFLLVDLVIGNKGKEKYPVSSVLFMNAVTADWRWYSLDLDTLMQAAMKIGSLNVKTFDGDVLPGEAMKGTAVLPIAKDASKVGFAFSPMNMANPIGESDPTVYVSLGIKGDFTLPAIPDSVESVKAGTTYKVGQAVKAPKRGMAIQVNGVRERTQSLPNVTINVADKLVIVDVTTRMFGDAKELTPNELLVTDSAGKSLNRFTDNSMAVIQAELGKAYSATGNRGLMVFKGARDAKGLIVTVRPIDPKSEAFKPTYFDDEKIVFDVGGAVTQSTTTASAASSSTGIPGLSIPGLKTAPSVATGPKLGDASSVPAELKPITPPSGFSVVAGSTHRSTSGNTFESADASYFGKMKIKDIADYYKKLLANEWESVDEYVETGEMQFSYMNKKDDTLNLYVNAEETDLGTTIDVRIEKY